MNQKYYFAAEVNKIQDTLFAASLQRQVVGGSRLLAVFSEKAAEKAGDSFNAESAIIKAGGKFRLVFSDEQEARDFGRYLADTYTLLLNGPLTVVEPILFDDGVESCVGEANCNGKEVKCFVCAEKEASRQLSEAKEGRYVATDVPQVPTTAFCESSGFGLAERFAPLTVERTDEEPTDATRQYMSREAYAMKEVGHAIKRGERRAGIQEIEDKSFLGRFTPYLKQYMKLEWAYLPEELAAFDGARSNIAYLVADANNMGTYFSLCRNRAEAKSLSKAVDNAVDQAISKPLVQLARRLEEALKEQKRALELIPALPLIAAGDDVFIMLPAPYALDYARHFCLVFEDVIRQNDVVKRMLAESDEARPPTMSANIVICKESYPYNLAHQRGEELQQRTKRVVKRVGRETGAWLSAVSFDVIVGSELVSGRRQIGEYRAGRTTYWATSAPDPTTLQWDKRVWQAAADLRTLLSLRYDFARVPAKRRAELRELFAPHQLPRSENDLHTRWNKELERLRKRIKVTESGGRQLASLDHALAALGDTNTEVPGHWLRAKPTDYAVHGISDLLQSWHYAQSLDHSLQEYREEREL